MRSAWASDTARRLRLGGEIDFTTTRIGQTLHIPCAKGNHIVDFTIKPGLNPDGVVKEMLTKRWTIGRRLACPDCTRKIKKDKIEMATTAPPPRFARRQKGAAPHFQLPRRILRRAEEALQGGLGR